MKLLDKEQMKSIENIAFTDYSVPSIVLMENAAHSFFNIINEETDCIANKKIAVFCGKGNNGGDGYAIARYLKNANAEVFVYSLCDDGLISGDSLINYSICLKMQIPIYKTLPEKLDCDIIIDSIFGIGFHGEAVGLEKDAIILINNTKCPTFSVDCPSGIDVTLGKTSEYAVKADLTVTFGLPKTGLYLFPARAYSKKIVTVDISIPKNITDDFNADTYLLDDDILKHLPERYNGGHKGTFGRVLCVCGSIGFTGAAELSATAAQKSGVGLVSVCAAADVCNILATKFTEIMTISLDTMARKAAEKILKTPKDALLIGCGIGKGDYQTELVFELIKNDGSVKVIDADGLNAVSQNPDILKKSKSPVIITPHIAEFARLVKRNAEEVLADRINLSKRFAKEYNVILVLKSADTLVCLPDGTLYILSEPNSGMAKGGSGDVLAGIITSFSAQGIAPEISAPLGVYIHSLSGRFAKEDLGEYFMTSSDIIKYLPKAFGKR